MERKFTDDEIVKALKALERIADSTPPICNYEEGKTEPPFCKPFEDFQEELKLALDHINRQKAESEKLEVELKAMRGAANSYKSEVEELTKLLRSRHRAIEHLEGVIVSLPDQVRAEAIKEFAERLKQYCAPGGDFGDPCGVLTITDRWIDHLVKEMMGENNGN